MNIDSEFEKLTKELQKFKPGKPLDKHIAHIRFPKFKNLRPGARVDFPFPITALVGSNGSGKTSVLHALYGAPKGYSTSDYWFNTKVDPIVEKDNEPNRFIYGHWLASEKKIVETRKARIKKEGDPDYWEPTKATVGDGMELLPPLPEGTTHEGRSKERWDPAKRNVLYLNFRSELGAFDKFFYFGQLYTTANIKTKQDRLRHGAERLARAIRDNDSKLTLHGRRRVFENRVLTKDDLDAAAMILGKAYSSARVIEHDLYGDQRGFSAVFENQKQGIAYSEAFAGSGEISVLSLVAQVRRQEQYTLILLDEPEVSLHPGAQERLLLFLMQEVKKKHHQVVFTTHSPFLVQRLPHNAIKVFVEDAAGTFDVVNESHPYAAFNRLGAPLPNKIRILVEDRLAKSVVEHAMKLLGEDERTIFEVTFLPGGASSYFATRIPTIMHDGSKTYFFLDGDQNKSGAQELPDPSAVSDADLEHQVELHTGVSADNIRLDSDGGNDANAKGKRKESLRKYLGYLRERVHFLPGSCPEEIVLRALDSNVTQMTSEEAKTALAAKISALIPTLTAEKIDTSAELLLAQNSNKSLELPQIAETLRAILKGTTGVIK
jgi:predicted ATPase